MPVPIVGYILTAVLGYFLGSIPSGFIMAKTRGVDIRAIGSGNIGATNVFRALGTPAGVVVLLVDALKGWLAVALIANLMCDWAYPAASGQAREWFRIVAGLAAVLGHNYTCWLYFKGGKGIATSAGVLVALVPWALLIIFGVWIIVFGLSRYVSLASIAASATLPLATWLTGCSSTLIIITTVMTALAICKHIPNIRRLLQGTENQIGARRKTTPSEVPKQSS
jgi:acyl phosphate:glycerol-3-phosphate acyltransferase